MLLHLQSLEDSVEWGRRKKSRPYEFYLLAWLLFRLQLHDKPLCGSELEAKCSLFSFILYPFRVTSCLLKVSCKIQTVLLWTTTLKKDVCSYWGSLASSQSENVSLHWTRAQKPIIVALLNGYKKIVHPTVRKKLKIENCLFPVPH